MTSRIEQFKAVQQEGLDLFTRKNKDYGDAFADYGVVGVLVRMGDKIRRLQNISNTGVTLVQDESLRDTLIDLHNYAAMAVLLIDSNDNEKINSGAEEELQNVIINEMVPSASMKEQHEVVQYNDGTMSCTCKGFHYHGWCYHITRQKGENARNARGEQPNKRQRIQNKCTHKWFVKSSTDSSKQYEVTKHPDGEITCTCLGFKYHDWCKHCEKHKN